ncbi:hypothetical protein SDC9_176200 [bioreactor metagenome]|uniref:Uncharacterized protein n=1 Tax=bioreactor metagenome TaxID=1076179 RepID=A0A645GQ05_9ZZZZ
MRNLDVLGTVKGIVARQHKVLDTDVFAVHRKIIARCIYVFQCNIGAVPQRFLGIWQLHTFQRDIGGSPERLGGLDHAVGDGDASCIPNAGTRCVH